MQELQTEKLQPIQMSRLPDNPLVSVLVANYNYDRYISETLESVLSQTYQN
ncbi:MAG: glycosyl transferase family 2, partial [Mastigocladus sp. ERB_26_1]